MKSIEKKSHTYKTQATRHVKCETFEIFWQNKLRICTTSLNKNRKFKIVSSEKSMNFADFH